MTQRRVSQDEIAGTRRFRLSAWLPAAPLALSVAVPASASAAGITFTAPPGARTYTDQSEGPAGYDEALAFRTTDTRPVIGIQADGGTALQCHFDNVFVTQTCGEPGPGCAAVCGSFQPASPLGNAQTGTTPVRPSFGFDVTDSNSVGTNVDAVACAWGLASTSPAFSPCRLSNGSGTFSPGRLPARRRLYRCATDASRATRDAPRVRSTYPWGGSRRSIPRTTWPPVRRAT